MTLVCVPGLHSGDASQIDAEEPVGLGAVVERECACGALSATARFIGRGEIAWIGTRWYGAEQSFDLTVADCNLLAVILVKEARLPIRNFSQV